MKTRSMASASAGEIPSPVLSDSTTSSSVGPVLDTSLGERAALATLSTPSAATTEPTTTFDRGALQDQADVLCDKIRALVASLGNGTAKQDGFAVMTEAASLCQAALRHEESLGVRENEPVDDSSGTRKRKRHRGVSTSTAAGHEPDPSNDLHLSTPSNDSSMQDSMRVDKPDAIVVSDDDAYDSDTSNFVPILPRDLVEQELVWSNPVFKLDGEIEFDPIELGWPEFEGLVEVWPLESRIMKHSYILKSFIEHFANMCQRHPEYFTSCEVAVAVEFRRRMSRILGHIREHEESKIGLCKMRHAIWEREMARVKAKAAKALEEAGEWE